MRVMSEMVRVAPAHGRGALLRRHRRRGIRRRKRRELLLAEAPDAAALRLPADALCERGGDLPVSAEAEVFHLACQPPHHVVVAPHGRDRLEERADGGLARFFPQLGEPVVEGLRGDQETVSGLLDRKQERLHVLDDPKALGGPVVAPAPRRHASARTAQDSERDLELCDLELQAAVFGEQPRQGVTFFA